MLRTVFFIILAMQLLLTTAVSANERGPYLGIHAGANQLTHDTKNDNSLGSFNLGFESGYQGNLTLGYRLTPNSTFGKGRVEVEIGYRQNDIDQIDFSDGSFRADGEATVLSLLFNTFGEYANSTRWTPYAGVGIGMAVVTLQEVEVNGAAVVDDDDLVLAWQAAAGVSYAINPSVDLDLSYRYFGTDNPTLTDSDGMEFESEYAAHNLQFGIRYTF